MCKNFIWQALFQSAHLCEKREGSGSGPLTNGSGSGRPKKHADPDPQHCLKLINLCTTGAARAREPLPGQDSGSRGSGPPAARHTRPSASRHSSFPQVSSKYCSYYPTGLYCCWCPLLFQLSLVLLSGPSGNVFILLLFFH